MAYRIPKLKKWRLLSSIGVLVIVSLSCYGLHKWNQGQQAAHHLSNPSPKLVQHTADPDADLEKQRAEMLRTHQLAQAKRATTPKASTVSTTVAYKPRSVSLSDARALGNTTGVPILELHSIANNPTDPYCISPQNFEAEMQHLSEAGYHTLTFSELEQAWYDHAKLPSKPILLTFDDGYEDNYTTAYPILQKYHLKATIFMVSGFEKKPNFLKWDQMVEMEHSGLVDIQSHTVNHHNLATISLADAKQEIFDSKAQLQSHLPDPIIAFCYPNGGFNAQIVKLVKQAGYLFATTGEHGFAALTQGPYTLDRELISGFESPKKFDAEFA